jgi:hypothetical protein
MPGGSTAADVAGYSSEPAVEWMAASNMRSLVAAPPGRRGAWGVIGGFAAHPPHDRRKNVFNGL